MLIKTFVPMFPRSFNKTKGTHWSIYKKQKDKWQQALGFILGPNKIMGRQDKKMSIMITTFYESAQNFLDEDNYITGCKPIYDVLKKLNYIFDDSIKWVERDEDQLTLAEGIKQGRCKETGTEIVIKRACTNKFAGMYL